MHFLHALPFSNLCAGLKIDSFKTLSYLLESAHIFFGSKHFETCVSESGNSKMLLINLARSHENLQNTCSDWFSFLYRSLFRFLIGSFSCIIIISLKSLICATGKVKTLQVSNPCVTFADSRLTLTKNSSINTSPQPNLILNATKAKYCGLKAAS